MKENILYKPFKAQERWFEIAASGDYQFILVGGSVRSGKTYFILAFFIFMCKLFPGAKYIVVRKNLQRTRDTVLPTFYNICPPEFLVDEPTQHNSWTAKFKNGSCIVFFAENKERDPDLKRFRGLEADGFGFEEMDISFDGFMMGLQRTGTWKMGARKESKARNEAVPPQIVLGTSNPQQGWVKSEIYDKWVKGTLKKSWKYIPANVVDNPYVEKDWIQMQKDNLSPLVYKMLLEGDWDLNLNENPFFYEFKHEKHVKKDLKIIDTQNVYLSFDFNYNPSTVCVFQFDYVQGIRFLYSYESNGGLRKLLDKLEQFKKYNLIITGDNNGHSRSAAGGNVTCYSEIEEYFLQPISAVTKKANALHEHSRRICNDALYKLPIVFDEVNCKSLISEIKQAIPTDAGKLSKKIDLHLVDTFRYAINLLFPTIEEIDRAKNLISNSNKTNKILKEKHEIRKEKINKTKSKIKIKL
jgi:hypothetical protein